jgi:hypothetical protein
MCRSDGEFWGVKGIAQGLATGKAKGLDLDYSFGCLHGIGSGRWFGAFLLWLKLQNYLKMVSILLVPSEVGK